MLEGNEDKCCGQEQNQGPTPNSEGWFKTSYRWENLLEFDTIKIAKIQITHCVHVAVGKGELTLVAAESDNGCNPHRPLLEFGWSMAP